MPILLILGPIVGIAAIAVLVAHASHKAASASARVPMTTHQFELDRGMPEAEVHRVLTALVEDSEPAALDALARELGAKYPMAAAEVRAKASALRQSPSGAASGGTPVPTATAEARRTPAARPPLTSPPDMSEAALVLQAAMKAYAEETDPVTLEGFADSIRAKFPTGAILLFGRARELQAAQAAGAPAVVHMPAQDARGSLALPAVVPPATTAPVHAAPAAPARYVVQPGDSPTLIAERLGRDGKRWPELVAANPNKPLTSDGTFASLRPGETLQLPPSWAVAEAPPQHTTAAHAEVQS
jgi:nucleoid-associated protein YgaU